MLFQPFDNEVLSVQPLKLKINPLATFRMQPCRFVRESIMRPLKEMIDQFDSEGVLVSGNSCDFDCPLIIVNIKDGGIRMAVDYRDVNLQSESTAYQLLINHVNFNVWVANIFFAKGDNLWGYHQLRLSEDSSEVTAIISPWGISLFGMSIWSQLPWVDIRQG